MPEIAVKQSPIIQSPDNPPQLKILDISREDFSSENLQSSEYSNASEHSHGQDNQTYTLGLTDTDLSLYSLTNIRSFLTIGSLIKFDTFEGYPIKITDIREAQNGQEYSIEFRTPSKLKTFKADATENELLILVGRLQNCVHYYLMESDDLAIQAKKSFEGIFRNLSKFQNVGDFLSSDKQGAFR